MRKRLYYMTAMIMAAAVLFTGCASNQKNESVNLSETQTENTASDVTSDTSEGEAVDNIATTVAASEIQVDTEFTANDLEVGYEDSTATHITLADSGIKVNGNSAATQDGKLMITDKGTYVLTGTLTDGQILIDAEDTDKIQLVFDGVTITDLDHAPIYIKSADKVFITLKEGSVNSLMDGSAYTQTDDNNVDGVIYSRADLTFNGTGTLNITGNYKHGIVSKDDLIFTGGTYHITTIKDAINGKDCVKIKDGTFDLNSSEGDGIESKNNEDTTKGYVYIIGGNITIESYEGIEGTAIIIEDGLVDITSEDDGLNSSSDSTGQTSGAQSIDTIATAVTAGTVTATALNETGIINVSAGTIITSTDTSVNGSTDATTGTTVEEASVATADRPTFAPATNGEGGFVEKFGGGFEGGFGGGGAFENDTNCYISISGGTVTINSSGDGIDSNGSVSISGGTITVSGPTNSGNGGLDYNGSANITGGIVVVVGSAGMAQSFSDTSTQYSLLYNLTEGNTAETEIKLTDKAGKVVAAYTPDKEYQSVVISTPDLKKDETYTLTCGTQSAEITLTSVVTSNGQQGMTGRGGFNGQQGMTGRGGFKGQPGEGRLPR